eukprot:10153-Heterococcus_DN1.PRE.2
MTCPVFKRVNRTEPTAEVWGYQTVVIRFETIIHRAFEAVSLERNAVDLAVFDVTNDGIIDLIATNRTLLYKSDIAALANVRWPDDRAGYDIET